MEAVEIAAGIASLHSTLVEVVDAIITTARSISRPSIEISSLESELVAVQKVLLIARDLIETQYTDDADAATISTLTRICRDLQNVLRTIETLLKPGSKRVTRLRFAVLGKRKLQQEITKINADCLSLWNLLALNGVSGIARTVDRQTPSDSRPGVVAEWLDASFSPKILPVYPPRSGNWFLQNPSFLEWEEKPGRHLWCSGPAGAGKTTLCSIIIDHLQEKYSPTTAPVLSFSFDYASPSTSSPETILRSLLAQIIRKSGRVSNALVSLFENFHFASHPPLAELWHTLLSDITSFDRVFFIFDDLDEYTPGSENFLDGFRSLAELSNASLLVTARPISSIKATLGDFVEVDIRGAKTAPKHSLEALFQCTMEEMTKSPIYRTALETLAWLTFAREPLTLKVLQGVLMVDGTQDLETCDLAAPQSPVRFCAAYGLVEVREVTSSRLHARVFLSHYSITEFLKKYLPKVKHFLPGSEDPETFITRKCLTILRFKSLSVKIAPEQEDIRVGLEKYPMLGYAARYWGEHAHNVSSDQTVGDAVALFDMSVNTKFAGLLLLTYEQHQGHYENAYQDMTGLHISAYFGLTDLVQTLTRRSHGHVDVANGAGWTALHWAARRGHSTTVQSLLEEDASAKATTKLDEWNALHLAAKGGHLDVVRCLIDSFDLHLINAKDRQGRTALFLATWGGHNEVVHRLLEASADPNTRNTSGATAFHCAVKKGHELIVRHLLDHHAGVNVEDVLGLTPMDEALIRQNDALVSLLSQKGALPRRFTGRFTDGNAGNKVINDDDLKWDLRWETYEVNNEETKRIRQGRQCLCHVLQRSESAASSQSDLKVLRKTFDLSGTDRSYIQKYSESERIILHRLRHPNVVRYVDFDDDPEKNASILYMEFCDLGDLITCHGRPLHDSSDEDMDIDVHYGLYSEDTSRSPLNHQPLGGHGVWVLLAQIASALAYLHYGLAIKPEAEAWRAEFERSWEYIIHRDIKPENVVVQSCGANARTYKLCDLGIASEAGKGGEFNTTKLIGTPGYMAPEVGKKNKPWTTKGDIWALGETVRDTNKVKDENFDDATKKLIHDCNENFPKLRPNSLDIMERAHDILEKHNNLKILPSPFRLQIQATHALLAGEKGGYILKAFNLVADFLDDVVLFDDPKTKYERKATLDRLHVLWKDGADHAFHMHPDRVSLHTLALLPLNSLQDRKKLFAKRLSFTTDVSEQWQRSRWTPLHLAVQAGDQEIVEVLLGHGARKDSRDLHGRLPLSYVSDGSLEMITLFESFTMEETIH